ncbi:MAG: Eco29kI family restriction endonuclease [Pseudomonadota bacterium]
MSDEPYNPLDKLNLGNSVASALLDARPAPLEDTDGIIGAGVYAIYYTGDFELYAPIAQANRAGQFRQPIYVGKAIPKGGRKGGIGTDAGTGTALRSRLRQHAASVDQADNLSLSDFLYKCLVVDDIWIPLGENMLIENFRPVWNMVIDGFGNKDPGNRRATQYKSSWHVLHPGRSFAYKLADGPTTSSEVQERLVDYFSGKIKPSGPVDDGSDE